MREKHTARWRFLDALITVLSLGMLVFLAVYGFAVWQSPDRLVLMFVPAIFVLWTLYRLRDRNLSPLPNALNIVIGVLFIGALVFSAYYLYTDYRSLLSERAANNNLTDMIIAVILLFIVVYATWKGSGASIPIVLFIFAAYAFMGRFVPEESILHSSGLTFKAFLRFSVLAPDGVFGLFAVSGFTLVAIFIFFADVINGYGGMAFIMKLSIRLTRGFAWGLAQIPLIASMFFGTFSGSAAANVAGTGAFTIPMMKSLGVPPRIAASIESVASSGGQVMPPVMGVAAFLMAEFLGVHYIRIVAMGLAPALLFYGCTAFSVYLTTRDMPISKLSRAEREARVGGGELRLSDGLPMAVAILVLFVFLAYFMSSVLISGVWSIASYLVAQLVFYAIRARRSPSALLEFLGNAARGMRKGALSVVEIMGLLCTMGVAAKMLVVSGLSQDLAYWMVDLSRQNLFLLLPLLFAVSIVLGMAVSTVVVYIVVVLLAAPALATYGIPAPVAHFTVFYLALLGCLTPPVAVPVAVACRIAKSPFFGTAWTSMKLGVTLFLLPFVFLFKQDIVSADLSATPFAFLEILAGFLAITYGIHARWSGLRGQAIRLLLFVFGFAAAFSTSDFVTWLSVGLIAVFGTVQFLLSRRARSRRLNAASSV